MNYLTTDAKTGKQQRWKVYAVSSPRVHLKDVLSFYGDKPGLVMASNALAHVQKLTCRGLKAVPLTDDVNAGTEITTRKQYRGNEDDIAPFTIRGKRIGELEATFYFDHDTGEFLSSWRQDYLNILTDAQRAELDKRFGKGVITILTMPGVLQDVKAEGREAIFKSLKEHIGSLRKQLDEIEAFNG